MASEDCLLAILSQSLNFAVSIETAESYAQS